MRFPTFNFRVPAVLAAFLCASCSRETPVAEPEGVVARIGNRVITVADLRREATARPELGKEELLHALLAYEAQLLRAQEVANEPSIRREIDRLLVNRLRERQLAERLKAVEVGEEEIKAEYDRRIADYTRPAMDRFALLFLRIEKNAGGAKRQQTQARMEQARKLALQQKRNDGFGKLSVAYSDDQIGRYRGGDIGWIAENKTSNRLPEAVLETGRSLDSGKTSEIVETDNGLYIVMKTDARPSIATPFEQVRGTLRRRLMAERRKAIESEFIQTCMQQAAPEIDHAALVGFELDVAPRPQAVPALTDGLPMAGK